MTLARMPHLAWVSLVVAFMTAAMDQLTKVWVLRSLTPGQSVPVWGDLIRLTVVRDPVATFRTGDHALILTFVLVAFVVGALVCVGRLGQLGWAWCLGLILGGAIGNLVDRLFREPGVGRGRVVAFIDYGGLFMGNIATTAVAVGAVAYAVLVWKGVGFKGTAGEDGAKSDIALQLKVAQLCRRLGLRSAGATLYTVVGDALVDRDARGAQDAYGHALDMYRVLGNQERTAALSMGVGYVRVLLGQYREALAAYEEAQAGYCALGDRDQFAQCLMEQGTVYRQLGEYAEAVSLFERARALFTVLRQHKKAADCNSNRGLVHLELGQLAEARAAFEQAARIYMDLREDQQVADCAMNLGEVYRRLGEYSEARSAFGEARATYAALGKGRQVAQCTMNMGGVHLRMGDYRQARAAYEEAQSVFAAMDLAKEVADCMVNLAVIAGDLGEYRQAQASIEQAKEAYAALGLRRQVANCMMNLGSVYEDVGRYGDARESFEEAKGVFAGLGLAKEVADCLVNLGVVNSDLRDDSRAMEAYRQALRTYTDLGMAAEVTNCTMNIGTVHLRIGELDEARAAFERARDAFAALGVAVKVGCCTLNLGVVHDVLGEFVEAREAYEQARGMFAALGLDKEVADCTRNLGDVYFQLEEFAAARDAYEQALEVYDRLGALDAERCRMNLAWCAWSRADAALDEAGQAREGLAWVIPAVTMLDRVRFNLSRPIDRALWATRIQDDYAFAFHLAHVAGDSHLVADLVENRLNHGVYTTGASGQATTSAEQVAPDLRATNGRPHVLATAAETPRVWEGPTLRNDDLSLGQSDITLEVAGAGLSLLDTARLPLRPPPALLAPYTRRVLADHLGATPETLESPERAAISPQQCPRVPLRTW